MGPRGGGPRVCLECMVARSNKNAREIARQEGPGYEKWLAGMTARWGHPPQRRAG